MGRRRQRHGAPPRPAQRLRLRGQRRTCRTTQTGGRRRTRGAGGDAQLRAHGEPDRRRAATRGSSSRAGACTATWRSSTRGSSDPRGYAWLDAGDTDKKLWVAAIDLNAAPGTDPSHPAFYLPAQELHAGNSRGYWSVSRASGTDKSCQAGTSAAAGTARPSGDDGALIVHVAETDVRRSVREVHDDGRLLRRLARHHVRQRALHAVAAAAAAVARPRARERGARVTTRRAQTACSCDPAPRSPSARAGSPT